MSPISKSRYQPQDVASLIREARTAAGLSQTALAERVHTTQSAVSRWEQGREEPRLSTLQRVLRVCGYRLELAPVEDDVDRAQIQLHLAATPRQRLEGIANVERMLAKARRVS